MPLLGHKASSVPALNATRQIEPWMSEVKGGRRVVDWLLTSRGWRAAHAPRETWVSPWRIGLV